MLTGQAEWISVFSLVGVYPLLFCTLLRDILAFLKDKNKSSSWASLSFQVSKLQTRVLLK